MTLTLRTILTVLCFVSAGMPLCAAPYFGEETTALQPDGTSVTVVLWGDEYYIRAETPDGYTVVRDPETGWICYAELNADGSDMLSTGLPYEGESLESGVTTGNGAVGSQAQIKIQVRRERMRGVGKKIDLKRDARLAKVQENRRLLMGERYDEETGMVLAAPGDESGVIILGEAPAIEPALTGTMTGLTLLVDFPDLRGTIPREAIDDYCNTPGYTGYSNNGSVRDYFYDISNGKLTYLNTVTEYYTARNSRSYYTDESIGYGTRAQELIKEALDYLESQNFNFSQITVKNGRFQALNVFYAGNADNNWAKGIWPHKGYYGNWVSQNYGIRTGDYQISNIGSNLRLGTFCHENGHMILGLPDLYDYGGESRGVGNYDLMAGGGSSTNPVPVNPYFRALNGWENVVDITESGGGVEYSHTSNSFTTYKYTNASYTNEYFMIESNIKTGRRSAMPDEGLLIWHVDTAGSNDNEQMTASSHYKVSVEQADGLFQLENNNNSGGSNDLFHAGNADQFSATTTPDSDWWSGEESGLLISNISAVGTPMTFIAVNVNNDFWVTPGGAGVRFTRLEDGPIVPGSQALTLHNNNSSRTVSFTAQTGSSWLGLSPTSGQISPQSTATITVVPQGNLSTLDPQALTGTITVTDLGTSIQYSRNVVLSIKNRLGVAYWTLDDTGTDEALDATGSGFNGILSGGLSYATNKAEGRFGDCLQFDGINDYIDVPNGFEDFSVGYTISFWANPSAAKTWARFIDFGNGAPSDNILVTRRSSSKDLQVDAYKGATRLGTLIVTDAIELDVWQHFVVAVDDAGQAVLYKNGQSIQTGNLGILENITRGNNYIGRSNWAADAYYEGYLDDVRIYNYALTGEEIGDLYANGGGSFNLSPAKAASGVYCDAQLEWIPGPLTQRHLVYFGQDETLVDTSDRYGGAYLAVSETNRFDPPMLATGQDYYWRIDDELINGQVVKGVTRRFHTTGSITYEVWKGISGTAISALTDSPAYPDHPDIREHALSFDAPVNWEDNYGTRMRGYLIPKTSGRYTFWIAGDDNCELWLSENADPRYATQIAYVPGWSDWHQWVKYSEQASNSIDLKAGKRYYIMALHKEGGGGDNLSVAWQGPDSPSRSVIGAEFLQPYYGNKRPQFAFAYEEKAKVAEGETLLDYLNSQAEDPDGDWITYRKLGGPAWLSVRADGTLGGTPDWQDGGDNYFRIGAVDNRGSQGEMRLKIPVANKHGGERGRRDLADLATNWLADDPSGTGVSEISDLDLDHTVDMQDMGIMTGRWQTGIVDGLVASYSMDNQGGTVVHDGYGDHDGQLLNSGEFNWTSGVQGDALRFDGYDDLVDCGSNNEVTNLSGDFSVSLWMKVDAISLTKTMHILGQRNSNQHIWSLQLWGAQDGHLTGFVNSSGNWALTETNVTPEPGRWYHVVMNYADRGDRKVRIYVDGTEAGTLQQSTASGSKQVSTSIPLTMGDRVGGDRTFAGLLDNVAVYNKVLSSNEIHELGRQDAYVAHWPFDTDATDSQGVNHGTFKNGAGIVVETGEVVIGAGALKLDGVDDQVSCVTGADITQQGDFSVSLWIKPDDISLSNTMHLIGQRDAFNHIWSFQLWGAQSGHLTGFVNSSGGWALTESDFTPEVGHWYHIVMTYSDSGDRKVWLYVNGVMMGTMQQSAAAGDRLVSQSIPLTIGDKTGGQRAFAGTIDDVRIYGKVLSAEDVQALANGIY